MNTLNKVLATVEFVVVAFAASVALFPSLFPAIVG